MNASTVLVSIAIVFAASVAGGLVAIVGITAELVRFVRKFTHRENAS